MRHTPTWKQANLKVFRYCWPFVNKYYYEREYTLWIVEHILWIRLNQQSSLKSYSVWVGPVFKPGLLNFKIVECKSLEITEKNRQCANNLNALFFWRNFFHWSNFYSFYNVYEQCSNLQFLGIRGAHFCFCHLNNSCCYRRHRCRPFPRVFRALNPGGG